MSASSTPMRWHRSVQWLHWLSVLLILAVATMGLIMVDLPRGDATRTLLYATHKSLGVTLLFVVALRLASRCFTTAPEPVSGPAWQQRLANATHALMYLLMLAIPLSGWLLNSVAGQALPWFGLFTLPAIAPKTPEWRATLDVAHVALFWSLVVVVMMHVMAVLHHQFGRRDRVLQRMLPLRRA
jgi:cytochrome b561